MTGQTQQAAGTASGAATGTPQLIAEGLARPHFFDGQYLNAPLLTAEQYYHRQSLLLTQLAGGVGVGYGLSLSLSTDGAKLLISPGVGFTSSRLVVLETEAEVDLGVLNGPTATLGIIRPSHDFTDCPPAHATAPPLVNVAPTTRIYVVELCPGEAEEGEAEVFGLRCKDACSSTLVSPTVREHVRVSLTPLALEELAGELAKLPGRGQGLALQSRLASAWFRAEDAARGSLLGRVGLADEGWCGAPSKPSRDCLPLGLLIASGKGFDVDQWIARRERIDPPARRHWLGAMKMRPYQDYLAQILQFQCQLAHRLSDGEPQDLVAVAADAALIERVESGQLSEADRAALLVRLRSSAAGPTTRSSGDRRLAGLGFVELPPAGFLPIEPSGPDGVPIEEQMRLWFGDAVNLEFVGVREDELGEAVESAQHRNRIPIDGTETVQILIPGGHQEAIADETPSLFSGRVVLGEDLIPAEGQASVPGALLVLEAFARADAEQAGGLTFGMLGVGMRPTGEALPDVTDEVGPYVRDGAVDYDDIVAIETLETANKSLRDALDGRLTHSTDVLVIVWISLQVEPSASHQDSMTVRGVIDVTEVEAEPRFLTMQLRPTPAAVTRAGEQITLSLSGSELEEIEMTFSSGTLTAVQFTSPKQEATTTTVLVNGALDLEVRADEQTALSFAQLKPATQWVVEPETVLDLHAKVRNSNEIRSLALSVLNGEIASPATKHWTSAHDYVLFTSPFASRKPT